MNPKLRLVLAITIGFLSFYGSAQTGYWQKEGTISSTVKPTMERLNVKHAQVFKLTPGIIQNKLAEASGQKGTEKIIQFPNEQGTLVSYKVVEKAVFAPELSAKYPGIKSYSGYSLENPQDKIRFSLSHKGIEAMIVHADKKRTSFLQKGAKDDKTYILYNRDGELNVDSNFICSTKAEIESSKMASTAKLADDQLLRTYRIAVSATGEYTQFHGGTVPDALAAINATLTRVNMVFETDLAVRLELIANNDEVIFTDPATDPYNGNLNTQVQNTLTSTIGVLNYDVGHLFHEDNDNGNAGFIGSVCKANQKGSAFSSALNPQGDQFDLDFVAHELGHQFGANHTWSFESEGTLVQAEPASGTTIMGYAGIVPGNNVAPNGDDYFHYYSILQIAQYLETTSCAVTTALTNTPPVITSTGNFVIPKSTAFVLSGNATDADVGDVLTYNWEQVDDGIVTTQTFGPDRPSGANFRSLKPTVSPERYFPKLSEVVQGNLTQTNPATNSAWETVSNVERDLNFALTVRDNASGGGQVSSDLIRVSVVNAAGPFSVSSQATSTTYLAGSIQTVNWDIAGTNSSPVNAQLVDIFLSTDGGATFPITLAENVANDGEQEVGIPGIATTEARIMVKASNNIFFAVNAADLTIQESPMVLNFSGLDYEVCQPNNLVIPFTYETYSGFAEEVTFSATGAPGGLGIAFSPATATANNTPVDITISNTASVASGSYPITITATSATETKSMPINVNIYDATFSDVVLSVPANGATEVSLGQELEWLPDISYSSYDIEIATDAAFNTVIESATVVDNSYLAANLMDETTYFWRVKPKNVCGEATFGAPFSFTTIEQNCKSIAASGLPNTISSTGTPTVTSTVSFINDLPVADVNVSVDITHSFLADLVISLTSPAGTKVILTANSCGDLTDINAVFDDEGSNFACGGSPGLNGTLQPLGSLASFKGESTLGQWTLEVNDTAPADGGILNAFSLEICVEGEFRPDDDGDGVFDDGDDLCLNTPPGTEVDTDGCPVFRFPPDNFTVAITSESCRGSNDGNINITAAQTMDYSITIDGNGLMLNEDFTDTYLADNLSAGTYTICITGTDGTNDFEPFCFEAVVTEPDQLGVSSIVNQSGLQAVLTLSGSNSYNIELNGIISTVALSEITLDLKDGLNTLKVSTDLPCQGSYEEEIFVSSEPIVYPNPFSEGPTIFLGREEQSVEINVYALNGRLVERKNYNPNGMQVELNLNELPSGVYIMNVKGSRVKSSHKIIKR
ncbi:MAG: reprolysin-like metallopeptidase [Flavobacteriaceae bacterium]